MVKIFLLSKQLTLWPTLTWLDSFQLKQDLTQFSHRLRLKEYFWNINNDIEEDKGYVPLRKGSGWTPLVNRDIALGTYINAITLGIEQELHWRPRRFHFDNLIKEQRQA